jgi:hypothetical protein
MNSNKISLIHKPQLAKQIFVNGFIRLHANEINSTSFCYTGEGTDTTGHIFFERTIMSEEYVEWILYQFFEHLTNATNAAHTEAGRVQPV